MPSFISKLRSRSRSTSRQRRDDNEVASPSSRRGSPVGGTDGSKRKNSSSSKKSTLKSSSDPTTTLSSKSKQQQQQQQSAIISPERRKFLGSKQRPNVYEYSMSSGSSPPPPNNKRIGRQISTNSDADSMAYSSNASEGSDGIFMTAFDRCPPTFSDDILDREDIFPTPSADYYNVGAVKSTTWETELAVLEDMSNEWTMFSDPSFENRHHHHPGNFSKNMGAMQREDENDNKGENARLVSPDRNVLPATDTAAAAALKSTDDVATTPNDDLSAWGFTSTAAPNTTAENEDPPATTTTQEKNDVHDAFGSNFFGGGFDDIEDDDFFKQSSDWTSPKSSTIDKNSGVEANNDPWGRINDGVSPFFDEKKDEDTESVVFTNVTLPDPITPTTEPTFSHPLKQQLQKQPQDKAKNEVVVSFEGYKHEVMQSPSNSSFSSRPNGERNLSSSEKGSRPPVTAKNHRRINSNGSSSRKGHRRISSNGSSQRRGGGGSVGSNSSAVDQILEHYRQKRLAKQNGKSSATSSTVSSSNHRSIPSIDSLSSVPSSSDTAGAAVAAPAAAAFSYASPLNDTMTSSLSSSSRRVSSPQSTPPLPRNQSNNGVVNWPDDSGLQSPAASPLPSRNVDKTVRVDNVADQFLMANIEATIGPRGSAPDIESLSGRSYNRSPRHRNRQSSDSQSIGSRTSRNSRYSFRTYESNRSSIKGVNSMSPESKSVANDLFRLEAQLAEVARQQEQQDDEPVSSRREVIFVNDNSIDKKNSSSASGSNNNGCIGAEPIPRQNPIIVVAPPGKLGILLLNNKIRGVPSTPTYVSAVRSESVLAGKVRVGDQLMKIDGEDVSQCNSKQIMAIMVTKSESERVLEFMCLQSSNDPQGWI